MRHEDWETLPRIEVTVPKSFKGQQFWPLIEKKVVTCVRHSTAYKSPTRRRIKPLRLFRVEDPKYPDEYLEAYCHLREELRVFRVSDLTILNGRDCNADKKVIHTVFPGDIYGADRNEGTSENTGSSGVVCSIIKTNLFDDYDRLAPAVEATCSRCGHTTESFGDSENSVKRCLALMREECPKKQNNYYVSD